MGSVFHNFKLAYWVWFSHKSPLISISGHLEGSNQKHVFQRPPLKFNSHEFRLLKSVNRSTGHSEGICDGNGVQELEVAQKRHDEVFIFWSKLKV